MTPEREAKIEAAFARLAAGGQPLAAITNARVYRELRGKKSDISRVGATWRAQQRVAQATNGAVAVLESPDAPAEAAPTAQAPPPSPAPRLQALAQERQTIARDIERLQRERQRVAEAEQQARFAARQALEALRTATRWARQAPAHEMRAAFEAITSWRASLAAYVGMAEAQRASEDQRYTPPGL